MKIVVSALLSLSLLAGLVGAAVPANAEPYAKVHYKKKHSRHHTMAYRHDGYRDYGYRPDYYEHIADKLPFGSSIWWEQMHREGRVRR